MGRERSGTNLRNSPSPLGASGRAGELENVEADITVDEIDQPARVERHVVALRRAPPGHRLRDEVTDLARRQGIGHVDDAQTAAEPDGVYDRAGHALAELMRAEARAADAAERRIHLAHLELADRPDRGRVGDIERQDAGVRAPAPRFLLARALRLVLLIDRNRDAAALDAVLERHHGVSRLRE